MLDRLIHLLKKILSSDFRFTNLKRLILLLSFFTGLLGGLAAVVLKNTVFYTNRFLTSGMDIHKVNILYLAYPLFGLLLTVLFIRIFIKDDISHGVTKILFSISKDKGFIKSHNSYSSIIGSTLTVGFGGSVGLEAPILLTGASIGSNLGRLFKLDYKSTILLIGCGVAGALAGIFKAPITAIIFGFEVLMLDLTTWSVIPLLISSVTGALVATFLMGKEVLFSFTLTETYYLKNILWYIVLGVVTGLISVYFSRCTKFFEGKLKLINNPYYRLIYGGLALGILIFLIPPLYGEGYESLKLLLQGKGDALANTTYIYNFKDNFWVFIGFLFLILIFKVFAMTITNGSGGIGGIFAPSLFMGGITGFLLSKLLNTFSFIHVSEKNFVLVGMAGLMAGVMHAPLTAIFLIAEITNGYGLFIPLIVTCTIAYITIRYFEPYSIYTHRLAERGELITHDKDKSTFILMNMDELIETNFEVIHPDAKLRDLISAISRSNRNVFPVVDNKGNMVGILTLNDIRHIIFKPELYDQILIRNIMYFPEVHVSYYDTLEQIADKIETSGRYNVPVLKDGKYMGFISRAKVFSAYRRLIKDFSEA